MMICLNNGIYFKRKRIVFKFSLFLDYNCYIKETWENINNIIIPIPCFRKQGIKQLFLYLQPQKKNLYGNAMQKLKIPNR